MLPENINNPLTLVWRLIPSASSFMKEKKFPGL